MVLRGVGEREDAAEGEGEVELREEVAVVAAIFVVEDMAMNLMVCLEMFSGAGQLQRPLSFIPRLTSIETSSCESQSQLLYASLDFSLRLINCI